MPDGQDVTDNLLDALNAHDLEEAIGVYKPRAYYASPSGRAEGRQEIGSFFGLLLEAFPDMRTTPWSKVTAEDAELTQWTFTGTHTGPFLMPGGQVLEATGRRVSVRGCDIRTLENGLILTHSIYYDQLELVGPLGAHLVPLGEVSELGGVNSPPPSARRWTKGWRSARFLAPRQARNRPKKSR
jgi:hypothetical protein